MGAAGPTVAVLDDEPEMRKVIAITAHDEPGTAERVRALDAVAYLKKPVDRDTLLSAIDAALTHDRLQGGKNLAGAEGHKHE